MLCKVIKAQLLAHLQRSTMIIIINLPSATFEGPNTYKDSTSVTNVGKVSRCSWGEGEGEIESKGSTSLQILVQAAPRPQKAKQRHEASSRGRGSVHTWTPDSGRDL